MGQGPPDRGDPGDGRRGDVDQHQCDPPGDLEVASTVDQFIHSRTNKQPFQEEVAFPSSFTKQFATVIDSKEMLG